MDHDERRRTRPALTLARGLLWELPRGAIFWLAVVANIATVLLLFTEYGHRHREWLGVGLAILVASSLACPGAIVLAVRIPCTISALTLFVASKYLFYVGVVCVAAVFLIGGFADDESIIGFGFVAIYYFLSICGLLALAGGFFAVLAGLGHWTSPAIPGRREIEVPTDGEAQEEARERMYAEYWERRKGERER